MRTFTTLALVSAIWLLGAPAASASTAHVELAYSAIEGKNNTPTNYYKVRVDASPGENNQIRAATGGSVVEDAAGITAGDGCQQVSATSVRCTAPGGLGGDMEVFAGDGDDVVQIPYGRVIDGGPGDDNLVTAGSGQLLGGPGNDTLKGASSTIIDGGPGADVMTADKGSTGIGASVSYAERKSPVRVTLDGLANDGEDGEGDLVGAGIASIEGGQADDVLIGDDGPNTLKGRAGNDSIEAAGGNDWVEGGSGDDVLAGGPGADRFPMGAGDDIVSGGADVDLADWDLVRVGGGIHLTLDGIAGDGQTGESDNVWPDVENVHGTGSDDVIVGSDGPNRIEGGGGNDVIHGMGGDDYVSGGGDVYGGAGRDTLSAYTGRIFARDGEVDAIDCGGFGKLIDADPIDRRVHCPLRVLQISSRHLHGQPDWTFAVPMACAPPDANGCVFDVVFYSPRGFKVRRDDVYVNAGRHVVHVRLRGADRSFLAQRGSVPVRLTLVTHDSRSRNTSRYVRLYAPRR